MSAQPKFTPGPWNVYDVSEGLRIASEKVPGYFAAIRGACRQAYGAEGRANADLIAAAPELYEALCSARDLVERSFTGELREKHPEWYEVLHASYSALRKAEGGASARRRPVRRLHDLH